jgi:hypothetical protein
MGFWGSYVVLRSERPAMELPGLRVAAGRAVWSRTGDDGWQVVQIHRGPPGWDTGELDRTLAAVMEQTGHPVLAAVVLDSDGAQLIGYSPEAGRWGGWLMLDRIICHIEPDTLPYAYQDENGILQVEVDADRIRAAERRLYRVGPPAALAAPPAVRWAAEAGCAPSQAAVRAAMEGRDLLAEDRFFRLLDALRLPGLVAGDVENVTLT